MSRIGIYAGSFDPVTNGHVDVVAKACRFLDTLIVAVGVHPGKAPLFSADERLSMLEAVCGTRVRSAGCEFRAVTFNDLVVNAAARHGATILIRGLRDGTDLDYEMQMAGMNETMAPGIHTVFLPSSVGTRPITATLVRQIAAMGGDVAPFVPQEVLARLAPASRRS